MATTLARPPASGVGSLPPARDAGDGGGDGGSGWVRLLTAANDIEAHLVAGRLAEAAVEVRVVKDRSAPGAWLYGGSNPWAPVTIMVHRLQLVEARMVLAEISFAAPTSDDSVDPPRRASWSSPLVWWSLALGFGLLLTGMALARTTTAAEGCELPLLCGDQLRDR